MDRSHDRDRVVGIILAGGRSRRMGGGDKGLRFIHGESLVQRIAAVIRPQVEDLILNANGDAGRYNDAFSGPAPLVVIPDTVPDFVGPLAGVLAGMRWMAETMQKGQWLLSVPSDTPFLPSDLVVRLAAAAAEDTDIVCASSGDHLHPVVALWRPYLSQALADYLDAGDRKIQMFLKQHRVVTVDFPMVPIDPFFNINTPSDLVEAERLTDATK